MAETAAYLVDHFIPEVPVCQWVLSLPIPLRLLLASQAQLLTPVLQVVPKAAESMTQPDQEQDLGEAQRLRPARLGWAKLLKRVFHLDLEHCPNCGGELKTAP